MMEENKFISMEDELSKMLNDTSIDIEDIPIDDITELEAPVSFDLDNIDEEAREAATLLTERLSGYYFDEKYLQLHPYIPQKIASCMDNVRRLMKVLSINEKALDILITNICKTPNKANLFMSLTSMQNGMLNVQKLLTELIENLENIFRKMQEESEKTWGDKDKEESSDGSKVTKGSREFIKELLQRLWSKKKELQSSEEQETELQDKEIS